MVSRLHAEECESFLELDARVAENSSAIRHLQLRRGCAKACNTRLTMEFWPHRDA